jgi:hypothetical protein
VVSVVDLSGRWKIVGRGRRVGVSVTEVVSRSGRNSLLPRVFAAEISACRGSNDQLPTPKIT